MFRASRPIVAELLAKSIEQGEALLERASLIGDFSDFESWKAARKLWIEQTAETLGRVHDGPEEADRFKRAASAPVTDQAWQVEYRSDSNSVREAIDVLVSMHDRLDPAHPVGSELKQEPADPTESSQPPAVSSGLEQEPADRTEPAQTPAVSSELEQDLADHAESSQAPAVSPELEQDLTLAPLAQAPTSASLPATTSAGLGPDRAGQVFLVHGRDEKLKQDVANLLERAGRHQITILNERPSARRMLVERFEDHTAGSRYAVILLTADDVGAPRLDSEREPYFSPRARQAVVFEMGVLVAALTPRCMCVLYEDGVELPCDLDGIAYVRLDQAGTWQSKLLLHLRSAGFDYDLNGLAPI